jgi:S1-C subfamily serine protease
MSGGKLYQADMVGMDPRGDVCLLKIRDANNLPYVKLGDSDALVVGEMVMAVGNPFLLGTQDFMPTVTTGVVSALHRLQNTYTDAIQTDASINPGNSGGPLFNMDGELVGINGQIMFRYGTKVNSGVGFAISINQIKRFMDKFKAANGGVVKHGHIKGLNLSQEWANGNGALVDSVTAGSTAEEAGFKAGDLIKSIEQYTVHNQFRFMGYMQTWPEGSRVTVRVLRGEEEVELTATLDGIEGGRPGRQPRRQEPPQRQPREEQPKQEPTPEDTPEPQAKGVSLGVRLSDTEGGVEVVSIDEGSDAEKAGLKEGDIIVNGNGKRLRTHSAIGRALKKLNPGDEAEFDIIRDGKLMTITVKFND